MNSWTREEKLLNANAVSDLKKGLDTAVDLIGKYLSGERPPYSGAAPHDVLTGAARLAMPAQEGTGLVDALKEYGSFLLEYAVNPSHPSCVAHLHCPPAVAGIAAELLIAAANQSMDSWDQSPGATALEGGAIRWLLDTLGWAQGGDGVFTTGGTASNHMGVQLALEHQARARFGVEIAEQGLTADVQRFRVIVSEDAHFSVERAAVLAGLGRDRVVRVAASPKTGINIDELHATLQKLSREGLIPFLIVGTCGTTGSGAIDNIPALADAAKEWGAWLHLDAAYGGALLFHPQLRQKLEGVERADSIALDFHKLFLQPIACAAFLTSSSNAFMPWRKEQDYLDRSSDRERGMINLVGKSLQTTRRADVLKVLVSMRAWGSDGFAEMIDSMHARAEELALALATRPRFTVVDVNPPLTTVVFRFEPENEGTIGFRDKIDDLQDATRHALFESGRAVIGQTRINGLVFLKVTILNPGLTSADVTRLAAEIEAAFHATWREIQL